MPEVQFHTRRIFHLHKDQGMPLAVYRPMWSMVEAFLTGFISQEIAQRNAVFAPIDENDPDKDWLAVAETAYTDESFSAGIEPIIGGVRSASARSVRMAHPAGPLHVDLGNVSAWRI